MKVLDVGSGHDPLQQADILADMYLENRERADDLVLNRPFIQADVQHLPFQDDAFDFVNASQVVEHTENLEQAVRELRRVGKSGQIDCPAYVNENLIFGQDFHTHAMLATADSAYFAEATHPEHGEFFHSLFATSRLFRTLVLGFNIIFRTHISRYYWGDGEQIHRLFRTETAHSLWEKLAVQIDSRIGQQVQEVTNSVAVEIMQNLKSA